MIATWMLYCSVCALGLSMAAVLAEHALLAGRGPVRLVWISAVALSLLVPIAAYRLAPRIGAADSKANVNRDVVPDQVLDTTLPVSAPDGPVQSSSPSENWRATLARFDEPLAIAWVTLSLALLVNFLGGIVNLAWMRRGWQRRTVLGVPVFVSRQTGPAVVGVVSPTIVVPEWVLALESQQLALMLRHEQEHRRAGDGQLLTAAELTLLAMPWNPALWWLIRRLRVAVELDCDARVLRDADVRSYGDLLLEVARPRRGPSLMGATAFAERATQLERRIRLLARHRVRTSRAARTLAVCIGLSAVTLAWFAPHPPAPARAAASPAPPALAATPVELTPLPSTPRSDSTERPSDDQATSNAAEKLVAHNATRVELSEATRAASARDSARDASAQGPADSLFKRLFAGITLTPDQEANARDILTKLQQKQMGQDELEAAAFQINRVNAIVRQAQRNAALRALLTNDADRITFDARVAQNPDGGRGRSGGPPPDGSTGRRGGGGGRRGGGGGRGGAALDSIMVSFENVMTEMTFRRLFDRIQLTADQEASARALITKAQEEIRAQTPIPSRVLLRLNPVSGVVSMQAPSAAALIALVSNDADRAKLQSRILNSQ